MKCEYCYVNKCLLGQKVNRDPTLKVVGLVGFPKYVEYILFVYSFCIAANSGNVPYHNPKNLDIHVGLLTLKIQIPNLKYKFLTLNMNL